MLARKEIGKGACHLIAPSGVLELGEKKTKPQTNRKWSDKKTVLFYKRTINKTDHTSALFMHSARLIAHQKRGCSTQRRRRRERCHERNDVGGAGFVKKLPGQAPAASLYFRPVQCGFRCTDVGEASTQEHPNIEGKGETTRNTKKKVSFDRRV